MARKIAEEVGEPGGRVRTGARVESVASEAGGLRVETASGPISVGRLVNCAGLHSDRVARECGVDLGVRIVAFRGDYFRVKALPAALRKFPVYPAPDPKLLFLGVHFTSELEGRGEAGPNAALAFSREGYDLLDIDLRDLAETFSYTGSWRVVARYWRSVAEELAWSSIRRAFARDARSLVPPLASSRLE